MANAHPTVIDGREPLAPGQRRGRRGPGAGWCVRAVICSDGAVPAPVRPAASSPPRRSLAALLLSGPRRPTPVPAQAAAPRTPPPARAPGRRRRCGAPRWSSTGTATGDVQAKRRRHDLDVRRRVDPSTRAGPRRRGRGHLGHRAGLARDREPGDGSRYIFFASADAALTPTSCGGTARATESLTDKVEKLLGDGHQARAAAPQTRRSSRRSTDAQPEDVRPARRPRAAAWCCSACSASSSYAASPQPDPGPGRPRARAPAPQRYIAAGLARTRGAVVGAPGSPGSPGPPGPGSHARGQRAAHLLELGPRGHLLGVDRGLDAVEEALEPADELGLRDPQLALGGRALLGEGQRSRSSSSTSSGARPGSSSLMEACVDLLEPLPARLVEGRGLHLLEQLADHAADPHHLGRLLDQLGDAALALPSPRPSPPAASGGRALRRGDGADRLTVGPDHDHLLLATLGGAGAVGCAGSGLLMAPPYDAPGGGGRPERRGWRSQRSAGSSRCAHRLHQRCARGVLAAASWSPRSGGPGLRRPAARRSRPPRSRWRPSPPAVGSAARSR